jgi:hypothetical protein
MSLSDALLLDLARQGTLLLEMSAIGGEPEDRR